MKVIIKSGDGYVQERGFIQMVSGRGARAAAQRMTPEQAAVTCDRMACRGLQAETITAPTPEKTT